MSFFLVAVLLVNLLWPVDILLRAAKWASVFNRLTLNCVLTQLHLDQAASEAWQRGIISYPDSWDYGDEERADGMIWVGHKAQVDELEMKGCLGIRWIYNIYSVNHQVS